MKKLVKYLQWLAFAISLITLLVYLVYTLYIKLNPSIIVTDRLVKSLKTYLIIALVSLFIGLLIILLKKIYYLTRSEAIVKTKTRKVVVSEQPIDKIKFAKVDEVISEEIKETKRVVKDNDDKVRCSECGNVISKDAAICPHCGVLYDKAILKILKKYDKIKEKKERKISFAAFIINIILIIVFFVLCVILGNKIYDKVEYYKNNTVQK